MEKKNQYRNLAAATVFLILLSSCLKPVLSWEIAENYSLFHILMFFAQWAGMLGVFVTLGMYWRVREMNWKTVTFFLIPCTSLYVFLQLLVFVLRNVFSEGTGRLSFIRAAEYTGWLTAAMGGTLFLWAFGRCARRYQKVLLIGVLIILGIFSGTISKIGDSPYLARLILGLPFLMISYSFSIKRSVKTRNAGIALFVLLPLSLFLFERAGLHGYAGIITEPQLYYKMMYLTLTQGMAGRTVWYLISVCFVLSLNLLVPEKKLRFLDGVGESAVGVYSVGGVLCTILLLIETEWYKSFRDRTGYWFYFLLAVLLFAVCANPFMLAIYRKVKQAVVKLWNRIVDYDRLAQQAGQKIVYQKRERLVLILLSSAAFAYTFLIFGPYELFLSNSQYLVANFSDSAIPMLCFGLAGFLMLVLLQSVIKGKAGDLVTSVLIGITVAGYLQGNFMNIDLGDLTGTTIHWMDYYDEAVVNTIIWLAICFGVVELYHFHKNAWKGFVKYASMFLLAVQLVAMASLFVTQDLSDKNDGFFAINQEFELAKQDNIVVFVADMMDTDYLEEILQKDPQYLDSYEGFTYYPNCLSRYQRTFPSVPYMLTETPYQFDEPTQAYFDRAWKASPHLHELQEEGYRIQLFGNLKYTAGNGKALEGLVANFSEAERQVPYFSFEGMMLKLLCYRDMPHVLKQFFWLYTEDINNVYQDGYRINDSAFYERMKEKKITVGNLDKQFVFYHLNGSHEPFLLDENAEFDQSGTDEIRQTMGAMKIISEYMEQMKALGIYEDATIIIMADHGDAQATDFTVDTLNPAFLMKPAGAKGSCQVSNVPVMNSDLFATVFDEDVLTDEISNIHRLTEDSDRVRTIYNVWGQDEDIYQIDGDAQKLEFWKLLESDKIQYDIYM